MSNKEQAVQQNRTTGISFSLRFECGFCNDPRDPQQADKLPKAQYGIFPPILVAMHPHLLGLTS